MVIAAAAAAASLAAMPAAIAQSPNDLTRTAGGLTVYIGVMPAEIVKGDPTMHGGKPTGHHDHHIVVAIFDTASSTRISDATVQAKVSGLGLSGTEKMLEPMDIADMITYGGFFRLPGADLYTVRLTIRRPGSPQSVVMDFKYDHFDP